MLKEWPLVAFTVAGQAAVGVFLFAALPLLAPAGAGSTGRRAGLVLLAVVLGLLVVAAAVSFFHVRHPFRARRALANLRTSWLSREILFELGFMALVAVAACLVWRAPAGLGPERAVLAAAALVGMLFLLSMSMIYMLRTVPFWNRAYTPLSFLLTSLSLGSLAAALVRSAGANGPSRPGLFVLLSFLFVAGDAATAVLITPGYGIFGHRPGPSLRPPAARHRTVHLIRLAFLVAALGPVGAVMTDGGARAGAPRDSGMLLAAALALVLAGQVAGRFLFYGLFGRRPASAIRYDS
jgi:anaerobic dimethyl sulfoxide reductase subunit C (anchor subunit)